MGFVNDKPMPDIAELLYGTSNTLDGVLSGKHPPNGANFGLSVWALRPGSASKKLLICNKGLADLAGLSINELLKNPAPDKLIKRLHNIKAELEEQRAIAEGKPFRGIYSWQRPDKIENYVEYIVIPINGQQDVYLLSIEWDITKDVKNAMDNKSGWGGSQPI